MTIIDAIRAAQADPTLAIHVAGDDLYCPRGKFPLRWVDGEWLTYGGDWFRYFGDPHLSFTVDEVLAEWETVPVTAVEAAGVRA